MRVSVIITTQVIDNVPGVSRQWSALPVATIPMLSLTNVTGVCSAIKLFSRWHVSNVHYSGPDCRLTVMSRSHVSVTRPHHSS